MQKALTDNENTVIAFLKTLEERTSFSQLEKFYHADVEQTEYPNTITKNTAVRGLDELKAASERGSKLLLKESYKIKKLFSIDEVVILEAVWEGTVAIPVGKLAAGDIITAYFAQVFEFKDGKIFRQRNYDCFEPFQ